MRGSEVVGSKEKGGLESERHTHTHTHKQTEKNLQTNRQVFRLIIFPGCRSEPADPGGVGGEGAGAGGPLPEADQGAHGQTQDCRHKVTQVL